MASERGQKTKLFGTAHVSNVDGRGIFSVFGVFKRQDKASSKPVYDYASVLCHVAGEIRDCFLRERLKDNEVLPLLETHSKTARGKGVIVPAPVEEAAKFLVIPCYEKAKEKGLLPANDRVQKAIEYYERLVHQCEFSDEEFLEAKLGKFEDSTFTFLDLRRPEFDSWWIEKRELEFLNCPQPPMKKDRDTASMSQDLPAKCVAWKRQFLVKLNTVVNRERFAGMAWHQAFWYAWKKEGKLGATMWKSANYFAQCNPEEPLNKENAMVDLVAKLTQSRFSSHGEDAKINRQVTWSGECSYCFTPAKATSMHNGHWLLTCVDKTGKAEFGGEQSRKCLATVLCAVQKYSVGDFRDATEQCLRDCLSVFLQHALLMQLWSNKPSALVMDDFIDATIDKFLEVMESRHFQISSWAESVLAVFARLLTSHCCSRMDEKDIEEVQEQFAKALVKVSSMAQTMFKEGESVGSFRDPEKLRTELMLEAVAPAIVNDFNWGWKTLPATAKKKLLTCDSEDLSDAVKRSYEQIQKSSALAKCKDKQCPCQDLPRFQVFLVNLLSSNDNPVSFLKCSAPVGSVTLSEELLESTSELPGDMVSSKDEYVYAEIMDSQTWVGHSKCARLLLLCKITCGEIFTMLKVHLILGYGEVSKRENQRHSCAHCGMMEPQPHTYKMCSACKSVYYCNTVCQKKDWKAGHKFKCTKKTEVPVH